MINEALIKPIRFQGSGLEIDEMVIPLPIDQGSDKVHAQKFKINYPYCFTHKTYPLCTRCNTHYVPIKIDDVECFKCQLTKP